MKFSGKLLDADGLINPYVEFGFEDVTAVYAHDDVMYTADSTPVILSSVVVAEDIDIDRIIEAIYLRDSKASWGITPWGDGKLVLHLTINRVTRSATGETEEVALAKAWKYFNVG